MTFWSVFPHFLDFLLDFFQCFWQDFYDFLTSISLIFIDFFTRFLSHIFVSILPPPLPRLRAAVHYGVQVAAGEAPMALSKEATALITELALRQAEMLAHDVECFSQHAKRYYN